ncbi:hypothetical protein MJH12_03975, partial [bacterium]|nr:hypothetical protein [bacterium]
MRTLYKRKLILDSLLSLIFLEFYFFVSFISLKQFPFKNTLNSFYDSMITSTLFLKNSSLEYVSIYFSQDHSLNEHGPGIYLFFTFFHLLGLSDLLISFPWMISLFFPFLFILISYFAFPSSRKKRFYFALSFVMFPLADLSYKDFSSYSLSALLILLSFFIYQKRIDSKFKNRSYVLHVFLVLLSIIFEIQSINFLLILYFSFNLENYRKFQINKFFHFISMMILASYFLIYKSQINMNGIETIFHPGILFCFLLLLFTIYINMIDRVDLTKRHVCTYFIISMLFLSCSSCFYGYESYGSLLLSIQMLFFLILQSSTQYKLIFILLFQFYVPYQIFYVPHVLMESKDSLDFQVQLKKGDFYLNKKNPD